MKKEIMKKIKPELNKLNLINVNSDNFIPFLRWLVVEKQYPAKIIVDIVEKPWKWQKEFTKYMEIVLEYE